MSDFKIITTYVKPPIPMRTYDYSAHFDCDGEAGPVGWGRTIVQAIEDLQMTVDLWEFSEAEARERVKALKAFYAKAAA